MKILLKVLAMVAVLSGLYWAGTCEKKQKEDETRREAVIEGCAADWFGWMATGKVPEALGVCAFPFDANGDDRAATREELEKILPKYLETEGGAWPWTVPNPVVSKFLHRSDDPNDLEKRSLPKGTRVITVGMEDRQNSVRVYVRPDAAPKVIGFKVSGKERVQ